MFLSIGVDSVRSRVARRVGSIYRPSTTSSGNLNGSSEKSDQLDLVLHTIFDAHIPLNQAHIQAEEIQLALRLAYPRLGSVVIHTEPPEQ